jgi:hypothetical protein
MRQHANTSKKLVLLTIAALALLPAFSSTDFSSLSGTSLARAGASLQFPSPTFTDWTSVNTTHDMAVGTLGPVGVTFAGNIIFGVTDGSYTRFNHPSIFTPPLATSDNVSFLSPNPPSTYTYTVSFSTLVTNPRLHIRSLASTLTFSAALTKLSGQTDFMVSGNTVTGAFPGQVTDPNDANGTIELPGTFSAFTFTAQALGTFTGGGDGVILQIFADIGITNQPPLVVQGFDD